MEILTPAADILVFRGAAHESLATAFVAGGEVLLVDALAAAADVQALRAELEDERRLRVRLILVTHYMSDHMAGLSCFPAARVAAHRQHAHTFLSQPERTPEEERAWRQPDIELDGDVVFDWGRHRLEVFHNPGKTPCTLNVDLPAADLLLCSDNLVGNIAYLSHTSPESLEAGLSRIRQRGRGRLIPGHMGILPGAAVDHARHYLARLGEEVRAARGGGEPDPAIRAIPIETCLAPGITPTGFEREWHGRNLEQVLERGVFMPHDRDG